MSKIEDIINGKCAIINNGHLDDLGLILKSCFPEDVSIPMGNCKYYFKYLDFKNPKNTWTCGDILPKGMYSVTINEIMSELSTITEKKENNNMYNIFEPKFGDKVLVSQDNKYWFVRKFITNTNNSEYKYAVTDWVNDNKFFQRSHCLEFYKYVKSPKVIVSKRDIAIWKRCNVEDIEII